MYAIICFQCGLGFQVKFKGELKRKYCSQPCEWKSKTGKKNPKTTGYNNGMWKENGRATKNLNGYVYVKSHNHPNRNKQDYIKEHRLVMEKHLGRYLTREEVVHHINGIKNDNRIENLTVFKSSGEHSAHHHKLKRLEYC